VPAPPAGSSLAVLSLVGPNHQLQHVGLTIFENGSASCPAAPLDPDQKVRESVKRAVETTAPGIRQVELPCAGGRNCGAADFPNAYQYAFPAGPDTFGVGNIKEALRATLAASPADRVLVVYRTKFEAEVNLGEWVRGIGIFHRSMLGLLPRGYLHAAFGAALVDGRTLETISSSSKLSQDALEESLWPGADCAKVTPTQRAMMTAKFGDLIDKEVRVLLSQFGLSPATA
jgi:hypothetical protein